MIDLYKIRAVIEDHSRSPAPALRYRRLCVIKTCQVKEVDEAALRDRAEEKDNEDVSSAGAINMYQGSGSIYSHQLQRPSRGQVSQTVKNGI